MWAIFVDFWNFWGKKFLLCFHNKGLSPGPPDDKLKVFLFLFLISKLSPQKLLLSLPCFSSFAHPPISYWNAASSLTASFLPHGMEFWPQICLLASWGLHLTLTGLWCGEDVFLTASNRKQGSHWLGTRRHLIVSHNKRSAVKSSFVVCLESPPTPLGLKKMWLVWLKNLFLF